MGTEIFIFPVQLTTSRIGNLIQLINTLLLYIMTIYTHLVLQRSSIISTSAILHAVVTRIYLLDYLRLSLQRSDSYITCSSTAVVQCLQIHLF